MLSYIKANVYGDNAPSDWLKRVYGYVVNETGYDLTDAAKEWIDRHICCGNNWTDAALKTQRVRAHLRVDDDSHNKHGWIQLLAGDTPIVKFSGETPTSCRLVSNKSQATWFSSKDGAERCLLRNRLYNDPAIQVQRKCVNVEWIGRMCKWNLTEDSVDLAIFTLNKENSDSWTIKDKSLKFFPITHLCASGSVSATTDKHTWSIWPKDYVTVTYRTPNGCPSGCFKIITLSRKPKTKFTKNANDVLAFDNAIISIKGGLTIDFPTYVFRQLMHQESGYPAAWQSMCWRLSAEHLTNNPENIKNANKIPSNAAWTTDGKMVKYVHDFYNNLKKAMPTLMAYRFYDQIFGQYVNSRNKSLLDYEDDENVVVVKPLPIMDVQKMKDVFAKSFNEVGNFNVGRQFSYMHCIVDLNPDMDTYNPEGTPDELKLPEGGFPMSFVAGISVQSNEYKTSKLVLSRVDSISGERFTTFTMGSHESDYDLVTDLQKRKYRDSDSVVDGAVDDFAEVTLGVSGETQRKYCDVVLDKYAEEHPEGKEDDFYWIPGTEKIKDKNGKTPEDPDYILTLQKKYFKNKHFFIDPFELTIAQWCYAHGMHKGVESELDPKTCARMNLSSNENGGVGLVNFKEMERSYWKYLTVWERGEWEQVQGDWIEVNYSSETSSSQQYIADFIYSWKNAHPEDAFMAEWKDANKQEDGESDSEWNNRAMQAYDEAAFNAALQEKLGEDDEWWQGRFISEELYNPLLDTRPFYYATYQNVRGDSRVYQACPCEGARQYIIDPEKGDVFQMNQRQGGDSFMDILNSKVVVQT